MACWQPACASSLTWVCDLIKRLAHAAQTITPGQAVRAQLAKVCNGPREAFDLMAGRDFFVEAKYDGSRAFASLRLL